MHVPKHEVGEIAVRRLVGNIRNPKSYTCKTAVSTYFVERQSVRGDLGRRQLAVGVPKLARAVNIVLFRRGSFGVLFFDALVCSVCLHTV